MLANVFMMEVFQIQVFDSPLANFSSIAEKEVRNFQLLGWVSRVLAVSTKNTISCFRHCSFSILFEAMNLPTLFFIRFVFTFGRML